MADIRTTVTQEVRARYDKNGQFRGATAKLRKSMLVINREARKTTRHTRRSSLNMFQMARAADLVNRSMTRIRTSFVGLFTGGVIGYALGRFVRKLAELNDEFKKTEVRLAGVLSTSFGTGTFDQSRPMARTLQRQLAFKAAATPGTASELQQAFVQLAPQVGLGTKALTDFSAKLLTAGEFSRGQFGRQQIAGDVLQALGSGKIGRRKMVDLANTFNNAGMSIDQFNNAGTRAEKMEILVQALDGLGEQMDVLKESFGFQVTTLVSYLELFTTSLTSDFTGKLGSTIGSVTDSMSGNFGIITALLDQLAPVFTALAASLGPLALAFGGVTAGTSLLGGVLGAAGGSGLGSVIGGPLGTLLGGSGGTVLGGGAGALVGIMAGLAAIISMLATGVAGAVGMLGIYAAFKADASEFETLGRRVNTVITQIRRLFDRLVETFAGLYEYFRPALESLGRMLVGEVNDSLMELAKVLRGLGDTLPAVADMLKGVDQAFQSTAYGMLREVRALWIGFKDAIFEDPGMRVMALAAGIGPVNAANRQALMNADIKSGVARDQAKYWFDQAAKRLAVAWHTRNRPFKMTKAGGDDDFGADASVPKTVQNFTGPINIIVKTDTIEDPQRAAGVLEMGFTELVRRAVSAKGRSVGSNAGGR